MRSDEVSDENSKAILPVWPMRLGRNWTTTLVANQLTLKLWYPLVLQSTSTLSQVGKNREISHQL